MQMLKHLAKPKIDVVEKYGVSIHSKPPYVLVGRLFIGRRILDGIIAFVSNEFHAHLIQKRINNGMGHVKIERTEYHPEGQTFNITRWLDEHRPRKPKTLDLPSTR
jgi:hypothetical protein